MLNDFSLAGLIDDPIIQAGTVAVAGVIVTRVLLRRHPTWKLLAQVTFFSVLTALLLYHGIVPYQIGPTLTSTFERLFVGVAKMVWWINATWALVGFVRVYLIFEGQPREGRLVQDLVIGLIYLGAILSIVAYVFSFPVGTLIATSGVFALILGLALQSTLADVFSGIALNLGRPYSIGDWIVLKDGVEGKVVETNWRSTHLLNGTNDLVVLPNSFLAKVGLTNFNSPERSHGVNLIVRIVPSVRPAVAADVMRTVLLSSTTTLLEPSPSVQIKALNADAIELEVSFRVADFGKVNAAKNEIFDLIYRHLKAAGLALARPLEAMGPSSLPDELTKPKRPSPLRLLDAVALFSSLTDDEKETLAASMTRKAYRKDAVLLEQGNTAASLMVVRSGVLLATKIEGSRTVELGRLAPGDYFGDTGLLLGAAEPATLRALTFVVAYEIDQASLTPLLHDRPAIAEELAATLMLRIDRAKNSAMTLEKQNRSAVSVVHRIRHLFDLQHLD